VALGDRSWAFLARPHPQRHITADATEELNLVRLELSHFAGFRKTREKRSTGTVHVRLPGTTGKKVDSSNFFRYVSELEDSHA